MFGLSSYLWRYIAVEPLKPNSFDYLSIKLIFVHPTRTGPTNLRCKSPFEPPVCPSMTKKIETYMLFMYMLVTHYLQDTSCVEQAFATKMAQGLTVGILLLTITLKMELLKGNSITKGEGEISDT